MGTSLGRISIPYSTIKMPALPQGGDRAGHVSIPYSTIKIDQFNTDYWDNKVSIPYSTIKIYHLRKAWPFGRVFQFLIVRLKLRIKYHFVICSTVSIPYSTIKIFAIYFLRSRLSGFNSL